MLNEIIMYITYKIHIPGQETSIFKVDLEADASHQPAYDATPRPQWTALDYQQCSNCPLDKSLVSHCPLALRLQDVAVFWQGIPSYHDVYAEIITPRRTISKQCSAQEAVSSLMGLIMPLCGCPRTGFLRPMARFHLPFANAEETTYRVASMYLLGQYFQKESQAELSLAGLEKLYEDLHTVNIHIAKRLHGVCEQDTAINAVSILAVFSMALPRRLDQTLNKLSALFEP